jgi:ATP-dependent Clp protease ATP-binding subunit ClpB
MAVRQLDQKRQSHKAEQLASRFKYRIVGQPEATGALTSVLEKYQSGFYDKTKPIASMLFLGPTGVGKTGTAEAFAEGLFGDPKHMLKVDCAEFQHSHEIAKLVGSPPGYLGHRETHPFFTNHSVREKFCKYAPDIRGISVEIGQTDPAFTIIVFDEIEKASDALWNLLLGILDKGTLTTGTNEVVDLTKTVIIMTSNVGSSELADENAIGFDAGTKERTDAQMKEIAMAAARRKFMPEFLNRLNSVIMFRTLTPENLDEILGLELGRLWERVVSQSIIPFEFNVSPSAMRQLLKENAVDSRRYNARNLKRIVDQHVAQPIGRFVATGQILPNDVLIIDYANEWKYYAQVTTSRIPEKGDILEG